MKTHINEDELQPLAWLHEHAKGFDPNNAHSPDAAAEGAGLDKAAFAKAASYLEGFGLIGFKTRAAALNEPIRGLAGMMRRIWLTSDGENYMREVEAAEGIGRKMTVGLVRQLGAVAVNVATNVLTAYADRKMGNA